MARIVMDGLSDDRDGKYSGTKRLRQPFASVKYPYMDDKTIKALSTLDLVPGASVEEVKKSYRELALIWHPDKVPAQVKDRATTKFTEINEAYQWLVRNPDRLKASAAFGSSSTRPSPPRYRSARGSSEGRAGGARTDRARTGASSRTGSGASSQSGSGASADPAVQRIRRAAQGTWTDAGSGLYIYPDIDADRAANFVVSLQQNALFKGAASTVNDLLVFYDIDGSGEEGMAITRSNRLVNNNVSASYDIGELEEVRLKEGLFWSEIVVRRRGRNRFERVGYVEKSPGRALANILVNMLTEDRGR